MGELGCSNLQEAYDMSWAEFRIRSEAYWRMEVNDWKKVRKIAFTNLIGPHQDPKKLPKSEIQFMPFGDKPKSKLTDKHIQALKNAWAEYDLKRKQSEEKNDYRKRKEGNTGNSGIA